MLGSCTTTVGGLGPFARGRMQFYPSRSNKNKVATHNGNPPRGKVQGAKARRAAVDETITAQALGAEPGWLETDEKKGWDVKILSSG